MRFKRAINFLEWMEEGQLELPNVTLSLHGNQLFVKGDFGDFDIEVPEDQIEDVTQKMQSAADAAGEGGEEGGGDEEQGPDPDDDDMDGTEDDMGGEEDNGPMGASSGEPGQLGRKVGSLSGM